MNGYAEVDYDREAGVWRVIQDAAAVRGDDGEVRGWLDYTEADRVAQELSPPPKFSPDVLR